MKIFVLLTYLFSMGNLFAAMPDWIGKVIAIEGEVMAKAENLQERILNQGSNIYEKETIQVGDHGKIQIRFTDGAIVNLIENTAYSINDYSYRILSQKDRFSATIFKGGFRNLTGSIAKKNPEEFEVRTPSATIGLRGTLFDVVVQGEQVFVGVEKGKVEISNHLGITLIGPEEEHRFAQVFSSDSAPQTLSSRPTELDANLFDPPKGGTDTSKTTARPGSGMPGAPIQDSFPTPKTQPVNETQTLPSAGSSDTGSETQDTSSQSSVDSASGTEISPNSTVESSSTESSSMPGSTMQTSQPSGGVSVHGGC
jgi:hypothetical protein